MKQFIMPLVLLCCVLTGCDKEQTSKVEPMVKDAAVSTPEENSTNNHQIGQVADYTALVLADPKQADTSNESTINAMFVEKVATPPVAPSNIATTAAVTTPVEAKPAIEPKKTITEQARQDLQHLQDTSAQAKQQARDILQMDNTAPVSQTSDADLPTSDNNDNDDLLDTDPEHMPVPVTME